MYPTILALHSLVRWFVLVSLLFAIYRAYRGWLSGRIFSRFDNSARYWTVTFAHIQLVLGVWLYLISPIVHYFLHNYHVAVHQREIRFFGMEHVIMMVIAITLITTGAAKVRRKPTDREKFRTMATWFTMAVIIIFASIPWKFSPLTSRPYFRHFQSLITSII